MRISLCANGHFYEFLRNYNFAEPCNLQILSRIPPRTHRRYISDITGSLVRRAREKNVPPVRLFEYLPLERILQFSLQPLRWTKGQCEVGAYRFRGILTIQSFRLTCSIFSIVVTKGLLFLPCPPTAL